ncbi:MAG: hypothetical protein H0T15_03415 [Thermoleophilaceae bacterium]|nr:hypothetical protein [Thermoleophilaceae bacterium]
MTVLQRNGSWLLLIFAAALAIYGLGEQRDVVVLAGALLAAFGVALARIDDVPRRESSRSVISAQLRRDLETRVAEQLRHKRSR